MLEQNPLVSVIVPVYNVDIYLKECLESIVNQTYAHLEILLINDASTDDGKAICEAYAKQDRRVTCIHLSDNVGLSAARNIGIENATGEFLTFVDSDDFLALNFIEQLLNRAVKHAADLVISSFYSFDEEQRVFLFHHAQWTDSLLPLDDLLVKRYARQTSEFITAWGKLYHRRLFNGSIPLRFQKGRLFEDLYLTHRCFLQSAKIWYLPEPLYCWRQKRVSSITSMPLSEKGARDELEGAMQFLLDMTISGHLTNRSIASHRLHLLAIKERLEANGLQQTSVYQELSYQLTISEQYGL